MVSEEDSRKLRRAWRAHLRSHAESVWHAGSSVPVGSAEALDLLTRALGPLADDAVRIVEAYAAGARKLGNGSPPAAEFGSRLQIVLNGIEASLGQRFWLSDKQSASPPHMIQSELWQVLRMVRESAGLSYSREYKLIELDRRVVFLLQKSGPLVPAEVSNAVGVDKAQVSRSVKRLLELALVEREQIRSPLILTGEGEQIARRMLRLADLRNRELTVDVSEEQLGEFYDTIDVLLERAVALYDQERALAHPQAGRTPDPALKVAEVRSGDKVTIDRSRVVAPLMTLSAYFSRSGALAYKRLTGLSTFEAFVLSEIGIAPPVEWRELVRTLERDHSQANRAVASLMERGLVAREGKPGRRHGRFRPTPEGACLHKVIHDAGKQRSDFLLAPLEAGICSERDIEPDRRAQFLETFRKIRRNAEAQLERERAFADYSRA